MAIAFDTSGIQTGSAVSSRSVSLTAAGSDRLAIIFTRWFSGTYSDVSSVTVNSVGATQIGTVFAHPGDSRQSCALYYYIAPPTSSVSYAVSWGGNVEDCGIAVALYTGVHQTNPITGSRTDNSASTAGPATVTVSSATGEWVVACVEGAYPTGSGTPAADGGQNSRVLQYNWGGGGALIGISDEAGAASVTESWTIGGSGRWAVIAARLAEAAGGPSAAILAAYYNMLRNS